MARLTRVPCSDLDWLTLRVFLPFRAATLLLVISYVIFQYNIYLNKLLTALKYLSSGFNLNDFNIIGSTQEILCAVNRVLSECTYSKTLLIR